MDKEFLFSFWSPRSPSTYINELNINKPAVYVNNAFGDSFFGPNQFLLFMDSYQGPMRVQLEEGDHVSGINRATL